MLKKKTLVIWLLFSFAFTAIEGSSYSDDTYNFKIIAASSSWQIDASNTKKRVIMQHQDMVSEVEVDVLLMPADQKTAEDVATFQIETYDGWQYHGSRQAENWEVSKANSDSGYVAMYSKRILATKGGMKTIIVAEKYFIKDRKAYIVSIATDNLHWDERKNDLIKIINSFRIN